MINGTGALSLRKQDLENQRIPAVGFQKTAFAHKASAGQTGINLTSLTLPGEMSANGFANPTTAQLTAANLLFFRNNLTLVSSLRGRLTDRLSFTVASSTQLNFLGFTAAEGEIFTGYIDYVATGSARVVGTITPPSSGTVAAGTTDFNVGTPYRVNQNSTTQIGAVLVFLDGLIQTRNTGNSSTTLDGNYYEVDAGGGLGTIIRFNVVDPVNIRNVVVASNGVLYERPDGSMMATIESVNGQVQSLATYLAAAVGQTPTTVLGAAPSNVDLKAFGDRVFALEGNRARIDQNNVWTAAQSLVGVTTGVAASAGQVGEILQVFQSTQQSAATTTNYLALVSLTLTPGDWDVTAAAEMDFNSATFPAANATGGFSAAITKDNGGNTMNTVAFGYDIIDHVGLPFTVSSSAGNATGRLNLVIPRVSINVAVSTIYYFNVRVDYSAGTPKWRGSMTARRMR